MTSILPSLLSLPGAQNQLTLKLNRNLKDLAITANS